MAVQQLYWNCFANASFSLDEKYKKGNLTCPAEWSLRKSPWSDPESTSSKRAQLHAYCLVKEAVRRQSSENHGTFLLDNFGAKGTNGLPGSRMSFQRFDKLCPLDSADSIDQQGVRLPTGIFFKLLQRCIDRKDLVAARDAHCFLVRSGVDSDAFLVSHVIRMFASLQCLSEAQQVFRKTSNPTVFSWSAIISAHANLGQTHQAIELYDQMLNSRVEPDAHVFVAVLKACAKTIALTKGKLIHAHAIENGLDSDIFVGNCLLDMYAKWGRFQEANAVFHRLPVQNVTTWNALIVGYANNGQGDKALQVFQHMQLDVMDPDQTICNVPITGHTQPPVNGTRAVKPCEKMQEQGTKPNAATIVYTLKACSGMAELEQGKTVHSRIIERGFESDLSVSNTLIDMYGKCRSLVDASTVFERLPKRDVVTWSVLIAGYTQHGYCWEALKLFWQMQQEGIEPDQVTFLCILKACSGVAALEQAKQIHGLFVGSGLELNPFVGSTLIDMYSKCGSFQDAWTVFDGLPERNVVTWNTIISGRVQHGHSQEALQLFHLMQQEGMDPDQGTFVSVLKACSSLAALEQGKQIHTLIVKSGLESDAFLCTTLIDMYSNCGRLQDARTAFERLSKRDSVTWNALIAGLAQHNEYQLAVNYFEDMQQGGLRPNDVTFICLLSACSHGGLVDKGCLLFKSMIDKYGIRPTFEHYDSMVDLYGHAGCLGEAEDLLETIPFAPSLTKWTSLLSSCRTHGNVDIGKRCFDHFATIDPGNASGYVLMSNIYAQAGMWEDAERVEELRRCANGWKKPARAFIEIDHQVHDFTVGNKTHPRSKDIYSKLKSLSTEMSKEGHLPRLDLVLDSVSDEKKESALCGHCEKLAIAFGLISTPKGTTLRVAKNLRVCADCHDATKIISKIEMREIIIMDAYRSHHFKDGACSCNDIY